MLDRTFIIAEAGVNHNGDPDLARTLVDAAADCGADAVKFQTFKADKLIVESTEKAAYQKVTTDADESQFAMIRRLELSTAMHDVLNARCMERGIEFMSTPFDEESADFLVKQMGVKRIKVPSGEITNGPFLLHVARLGLPIILSTGMSTLTEVEEALVVMSHGLMSADGAPNRRAYESEAGRKSLKEKVALLHCTTEYPSRYEDTNLRAMDTMREAFGLTVGLSDHTGGIAIPIAAVARGARIVEKHFTTDRSLPGPDHAASVSIDELRALIEGVRAVELAMGKNEKAPAQSELKNIPVIRRGLVAAKAIRRGEPFTAENVCAKRPAAGLSPMSFWTIMGRPADRDYGADDPIAP